MHIVSLDEILEKANEDYSSLTIPFGDGDSATFINALQLSKEKRDEFVSTGKKLEGADEDDLDRDQAEDMRASLRVVAEDVDAADRLFGLIGDNLAALVTVFKEYNRGTQAGEA